MEEIMAGTTHPTSRWCKPNECLPPLKLRAAGAEVVVAAGNACLYQRAAAVAHHDTADAAAPTFSSVVSSDPRHLTIAAL